MRHRPWRCVLLLAAACAVHPPAGEAGEVSVASASDLHFLLEEFLPAFERESGHRVRLSLGASGNLHGQILLGAPFDLFLSADVEYARRLIEKGVAEPGSLLVYAIGRLALWAPHRTSMDGGAGLQALAAPGIRRIALANPRHAPYGRAAAAALEHYGIAVSVRDKLVYGESVLQAAQFAQSGAADAGIIALSLALSEPMRRSGRHWVVPQSAHPPLEQAAVLLRGARSRGRHDAARALWEWLRGDTFARLLESHGFVIPKRDREGGRR